MKNQDNLRYFKKNEFLKDPGKLHPDIMPLMDELRHLAGIPIYIHVETMSKMELAPAAAASYI